MTTNAVELVGIDGWLYSVMSGDATLHALVADRIYADVAPENATFPYVIFNQQSAVDLDTPGFHHVWVNALYQIVAVTQGSSKSALQPIAERIHTLIQAMRAVTSTTEIVACYRESPFSLSETTDGVRYVRLGGIYRIFAQPV